MQKKNCLEEYIKCESKGKSRFISEEDAKRRTLEKSQNKSIRELRDPRSEDWTRELIKLYKSFFSDIKFTFFPENDLTNGFAHSNDGNMYVEIYGGIVNDPALKREGISLVIAHEVAHHTGGKPKKFSGLSCEGQADFRAARDVIYKVHIDDYESVLIEAIQQAADFFKVENREEPDNENRTGCADKYPPYRCRIATFHAGFKARNKALHGDVNALRGNKYKPECAK